jgi:signal peptidase II
MKPGVKILLFFITCTAFISCDRATKELAKVHLKDKLPISYYHDAFRLVYVENTGAFLSLGDDWPKTTSLWVFNILPLVFLVVLFVYTIRKSSELSMPVMLALALLFSGGMGNIIDRILFDRHVTDFMNLGINNLRTGIFNFADLYVTTGICIILFQQLKKNKAPKTSLL